MSDKFEHFCKREKQILKLKKKFGKDSDIPYKIAWSQHNKEKG